MKNTDYTLIEKKGAMDVFEVPTQHTVKSFSDPKEARKFMRHLQHGGGFAGWTPSFFLLPLVVTK